VGEKALEFPVELGRKSLVVADDQSGHLHRLYDLCHGKGLAGAGYPLKNLKLISCFDTFRQGGNGFPLVSGRLERRNYFKLTHIPLVNGLEARMLLYNISKARLIIVKRALRTQVTKEHSKNSLPQFSVSPGELFEAETELCSGDWLKSIDSVFPGETAGGGNPTVVIAVDGAKPGDSIKVCIHSIIPDALGYTGFVDRSNSLANQIVDRDWGNSIRVVRIEDGFIHFAPSLRLQAEPMIGTLGTAPASESIANVRGGRHGGNMDVQEVCAGAIVTLPVEAPGALLHIGDVHAIQGDGEINSAGGIECRALVKMHVEVVKRPPHNACVRVENEKQLCAIACEGDIETCCVNAARELLHWICQDYGMDVRDAYLLLGQVMTLRVTQLVNPTRTVIAKIRKTFLPRAKA
jgi:acetamidase/formamidase